MLIGHRVDVLWRGIMRIGNVLSLFDGMSCGQIALNRANITYDNYFASEIDKNAIQVTQANYPNTIHLGDITKWREWVLPPIDFICAGSPCQGFSFAGKRLNFEDERSKLFFTFIEILEAFRPKWFLLENVRMNKWCENIITEMVNVDPVFIDSARVSAQHRQRLYWTNLPIVGKPKNTQTYLKSITQDKVDVKYYLSSKKVDFILGRPKNYECKINPIKSNCLRTNYGNASANETYIKDASGIRKLTEIECERLQTIPDNYTNYVTSAQRYKMLGNGWTVDVIVWLLSFMNGKPRNGVAQATLFGGI